jgi:hypothetical protein
MYTMRAADYKGWWIVAPPDAKHPKGEWIAHVVFLYEANALLDHLNRNHKENT